MKKEKGLIKQQLKFHEIMIRVILMTFVLLLLSLYFSSGTLAKYKSISSVNENARVAKFGELTFLEYKSDGTTLILGNEAQLETVLVSAGTSVDKKLELSFSGSEVSVYLFFVVETSGWDISDSKDLVIKGLSNDTMVIWKPNDKWNYLKQEDIDNDKVRYVYYTVVDKNVNFTDSIMESLEVNSIGLVDANMLRSPGYSLSFKVFAVSKPGATIDKAYSSVELNS